uniref:Uncharacterized protein n=1 Tax=Brassica campestris TaxID=3711 RepID=A0A3P6A281_BRACM|nr:unnamed protein product [Brassica rapa]
MLKFAVGDSPEHSFERDHWLLLLKEELPVLMRWYQQISESIIFLVVREVLGKQAVLLLWRLSLLAMVIPLSWSQLILLTP